MRQNFLLRLLQHSQTPFKLPWSSSPVPVNPLDLAISLIWSQHRPLALFHQKIQNKPLITYGIPYNKSPFIWPKKMQEMLNLSTTNFSNNLLFRTANPQPFLSEKFENKVFFSPMLNSPIFFLPIFHDFCEEKQATSVKRKRRLKMNKHKFEKRRDKQRALRKRLGK